MTQTATFPNLESLPNVATQAFLYFNSSMGTLTEVDVVTSGSYSTEFHAENLGASTSRIAGTTSGNLSINLPSGPIPVTIPSITENFNAAPYDGTLDDAGSSGKDFAPVTSSSAAHTTVLTSPADLAAFTGNFRIPVSVSGHATGTATSSNGDLSAGFNTQTSATITIVYHYIPNLPSLNPPTATSGSPQSSGASSAAGGTATSGSLSSSGTSATNAQSTAASGTGGLVEALSTKPHHSPSHARKRRPRLAAMSSHRSARPLPGGPLRLTLIGHFRGVKAH
jgi:hypothetical protein